jgi:hypothetical protein
MKQLRKYLGEFKCSIVRAIDQFVNSFIVMGDNCCTGIPLLSCATFIYLPCMCLALLFK